MTEVKQDMKTPSKEERETIISYDRQTERGTFTQMNPSMLENMRSM